MRLMTWNIDWCRNCNRQYGGKKYNELDSVPSVCDKIINNIKIFMDEGDSLVCLQEVPYKVRDEDGKWRNHYMYNENFLPEFKKYETFMVNHENRWALARTMMISADKWKSHIHEYEGIKSNKIVQIEKNGIHIMGVHIPPIQIDGEDVEYAKSNKEFWNAIISICKSDMPQIILGDFNTDDKSNEQFDELQALMKMGYSEANGQASYYPTYHGEEENSHVDYILVRDDVADKVKSYDIVEDWKGLSDHDPLILEIDI